MSVEKTGPRGYEYQYLISVYIAVKMIHQENIQIFIESENGEDLQLQFYENEKKYVIDIQVKKRDEQIDLKDFAEWISHFESKSYDENLFTKLFSETDRYVLFVTNSRCKDDVSNFVSFNDPINTPVNIGINDQLIEKIKTNTLNFFDENKKLSQKRHEFLKSFFVKTPKNEFRKILKKYRLWDLQSEDLINEKISRVLNQDFFVPQSKIDETILKLTNVIRYGRDSNDSISSQILNILMKYKGTKIFDYDRKGVERTEKKDCIRFLNEKNVLLLTGVSFCGKTFLAKEIAQDYQNKGFTVKITNELYGDSGGNAFLKHKSQEDRLLILEDPFGHIITDEKSIEILIGIKKLIENSDSHRKLIITSKKDIVLSTLDNDSLANSDINGNKWIDLTVNNPCVGNELWRELYGKSEKSISELARINKWLQKNENEGYLQPGQLIHLHNTLNDINKFGEMSEESIIKVARIDSSDLAKKIKTRGEKCIKVFLALGLSCNTFKYTTLEDLEFILSDLDETPGYMNTNVEDMFAVTYSFSANIENTEYPKYVNKNKISNEYIEELRYLKNHGYIKIDNIHKRVHFTHPIYYYASKLLFQEYRTDIFESDNVLKLAKRSLSALSKQTNISALMMLESYYLETKDQFVKKHILDSLHSIYPSVRDRVIMFFDSRIDDLDKEEAIMFINFIKLHKIVDDDVLLWNDGEPYFNNLNHRSIIPKYRSFQKSEYQIKEIKNKIISKKILSPEEMWMILNFSTVETNEQLSLELIRQGLTYDEVFIREKVAYYLFKNHAFEIRDFEEFLDLNEHPNVIYKIFRGAISSWNQYSFMQRKNILEFYKKSLNVVSVAIRSLNFLENFEDMYAEDSLDWPDLSDEETKNLWLVWYDVFTELLNNFPSKYIEMDESHMTLVADVSLKYIQKEELIINFSCAWINWLNQYSEHYLTQDFGMSVADYLMRGTKNNYKNRDIVFNKLLESKKTSFITTNLKSFVDYWDYLSKNEKQLIINLLNSDRKDSIWLKAVVLNRKFVPVEIQMTIFGEVLFDKNIDYINKQLIQYNLLCPCLNVHCGFPQPLWWNGYHHNNYKLWDEIILKVLEGNKYNEAFEVSLKEFIESLYNHDKNRFGDGYFLFEKILLSDEIKRGIVFNRLFITTINNNQKNKLLWDLLLKNSGENELKMFFDKIATHIEAIQYYHSSHNDLYDIFDHSIIFKEIYPRIKEDYAIYILCNRLMSVNEQYSQTDDYTIFKNNDDKLITGGFLNLFREIYSNQRPRMSLTKKIVLYTMKKINVDINSMKEMKKMMEDNRINQLDQVRFFKEELKEEYNLENWIM